MEVGAAEQVGHHVDRQDADGELVLDAQPLGDRAVEIARAEPQFVGQRLGRGVEIGIMAAPAFLLASLMATSVGFGLAQAVRSPLVVNVIVNVLIFVVLLFFRGHDWPNRFGVRPAIA